MGSICLVYVSLVYASGTASPTVLMRTESALDPLDLQDPLVLPSLLILNLNSGDISEEFRGKQIYPPLLCYYYDEIQKLVFINL